MFSKTEKKETQSKEKDIQKVEASPVNTLKTWEDMDRMFDEFMSHRWLKPFSWRWPEFGELSALPEIRIPKVDVVEKDNELLVKAEIPGIDKNDVDISLTENTVTIKGKSSKEEKEEKGDYHRCEISKASFSRTVTLPSEVNVEGAKAKVSNGVLEVTIPKAETKKRHSVKVE